RQEHPEGVKVDNLEVAGAHTYLVADENGKAVRVHDATSYHYTNSAAYKGTTAGSRKGEITLKISTPVRNITPPGVYLTPVPPEELKNVGLANLGLTNEKVEYVIKIEVPDELIEKIRGPRGNNVKKL